MDEEACGSNRLDMIHISHMYDITHDKWSQATGSVLVQSVLSHAQVRQMAAEDAGVAIAQETHPRALAVLLQRCPEHIAAKT